MGSQKLTMTQALVKYLMAQKRKMEETGEVVPLLRYLGVLARGNVAGLVRPLLVREEFPTHRGHTNNLWAVPRLPLPKRQEDKE